MTSDGGGKLQDPYNLVALLGDHVEIVDHEAIADFAIRHHRLRAPTPPPLAHEAAVVQ